VPGGADDQELGGAGHGVGGREQSGPLATARW
jgi:hypothetical protein